MRRMIIIGFIGVSILLTGCASNSSSRANSTPDYTTLYEHHEYTKSFEAGQAAYSSSSGADRDRAALTTGLSAAALERETDAERWLRPLVNNPDAKISGSAGATLGMLAQRKSRHAEAVTLLTAASEKLTGDDKARALMFAGDSMQAVGRKADAQASYEQAAAIVTASDLRTQVSARIAALGKVPASQSPTPAAPTGAFTVQIASYSDYQRAMSAVARLQPKAASASLANPRVVQVSKNGQTLYSVRIGRYPTRAEGEMARRKLGNEGLVMVASGE